MNETALKERLKFIANALGVTSNEVWKHLLLERFLARVSHSKHHNHFIFKGGLLLAQYLEIGRETVDVDFLMTKLKSELPKIKTAFMEIAATEVKDDFQFAFAGIEELEQPHMNYAGYRVRLKANFGKMKDAIQIDIGVGDSVEPIEHELKLFEYKGKPIFEGEVTLLTYPIESIFAEKLETMVSKGAINSRMKDYHDVLLIIRESNLLKVPKVRKAVRQTFETRGTPFSFPLNFDASGMEILQRHWERHLVGLGSHQNSLNLPESFKGVLAEINDWVSSLNIKQ